MTKQLEVGDIIIAKHSVPFPDGVTEGCEYSVATVWNSSSGNSGFTIINDNKLDAMPVEAVFYRKEALK